ncbi:hypothetical protein APR41_16015 [Salegentibacter salinarum]|uniref:asparagine synthase (glutamine-hydrolyzing) n=1 Tax=Salegentibacter salinarum TaxID=447422 RepID=A0A2N0TXI3_9FLAO|nr:hypothetical protein [Salegentibacter salinarum]PKD19465.1 hypothetical protein APR41_16015 [Salegentibacter salinarum]SKB91978.1 asparagine synthase (glutamine-hydrolysing) [Salegentibacter salinarum]
MPGFNILFEKNNFLKNKETEPYLINNFITGESFSIQRFTTNKFLNDKVFYEDENCIILIEGVILNKKSLISSQKKKEWAKYIWSLYLERGNDFFKIFRGSFSGLVYDKKTLKWIIFTDHLGTKHIYYDSNFKIISSVITDIYHYWKKNKLKPKLDINAAYMLLSFGYMLDDNTLCANIKKLEPGHYILIEDNISKVVKYYQLPLSKVDGEFTDNDLETLDDLFRKAVSLQFDKDKEYGLNHFVALSGGLDSRMTSWVGNELGYNNQINFTFSQTDYLDETIPKKIAAELNHEWIFKALDNGNFLTDIDQINLMSGGNVLFYGLAHANSLYKIINFENLGIIHSGQLGDIVIGSFVKELSEKSFKELSGAYSKRLVDKIEFKPIEIDNFQNLEKSLVYRRGLNGANNGLLSAQQYTETMSPFYDIDFFEFCLSIPIKYRMNHKVYKNWIIRKYPDAANYVWAATESKITDKQVKFRNKYVPVKKIPAIVRRKILGSPDRKATKNHMNPLDFWYNNNKSLQAFQDSFFDENISRLDDLGDLKADCISLYNNGSGVEKNQVLTLLSAVKLFF